ncbi:Crp/Fnr family transcriptional regulator [Aquimarina aquimarini]|uniref:Crp/Fnr family transcriptional regulator n=1 Tax=Aquimarina aquimarini TaxID=1191734 RepID=UPI000D5539C6|nr:Crp/Fnr family transcriptional regulator [Aquimarina aquimarini]
MNLDIITVLINEKKYKTYSDNKTICLKQKNFNKIYLVKIGIVKINMITDQGQHIIISLQTKNEIIGACLTVKYDNYPSYLIVPIAKKTILFEFDITDVYKLINQKSIFKKSLLSIINWQHSKLEKRIQLLQIQSTEQRFIKSLIEFKEKFRNSFDHSKKNIEINSPLNQNEFATYIRTTRINMNIIVNTMKKEKLINYKYKNIILKEKFIDLYLSYFYSILGDAFFL